MVFWVTGVVFWLFGLVAWVLFLLWFCVCWFADLVVWFGSGLGDVLVWLVVSILYGWDLVVFVLVFWGLVALLRAGLAGVWDCLRVGLVACVCGFWWVCYGSGLGLL